MWSNYNAEHLPFFYLRHSHFLSPPAIHAGHQEDSASTHVRAPPTPTDNEPCRVAGLLSGMPWDSSPAVPGPAPTGMTTGH